MDSPFAPAFGVVLLLLIVSLAATVSLLKRYISLRSEMSHARQDAVKKSQAVIRGKVAEQLVPYLPGFSFDPKDARFIGSPIDFVVFDGLNAGEVKSVVFLEVKTGTSGLSARERRVKEAIQSRRVDWQELRIQL